MIFWFTILNTVSYSKMYCHVSTLEWINSFCVNVIISLYKYISSCIWLIIKYNSVTCWLANSWSFMIFKHFMIYLSIYVCFNKLVILLKKKIYICNNIMNDFNFFGRNKLFTLHYKLLQYRYFENIFF